MGLLCVAGSPVLLSAQNVSFVTRQDFAVGAAPSAVAVGDFNGDGKSDLAVASADAAYVRVGNGDGNFQAPQPFAASGDGLSIASGDFHGDGKSDLVVSNLSSTHSVLDNSSVQTSYSLAVSEAGNGSGAVTSSPAGIHCGAACTSS